MDSQKADLRIDQEIKQEKASGIGASGENSLVSDELSLMLEDEDVVSTEKRHAQPSASIEDPEWFNDFVTPQRKNKDIHSGKTGSIGSGLTEKIQSILGRNAVFSITGGLLCIVLSLIGLYWLTGGHSESSTVSLPLTIPPKQPVTAFKRNVSALKTPRQLEAISENQPPQEMGLDPQAQASIRDTDSSNPNSTNDSLREERGNIEVQDSSAAQQVDTFSQDLNPSLGGSESPALSVNANNKDQYANKPTANAPEPQTGGEKVEQKMQVLTSQKLPNNAQSGRMTKPDLNQEPFISPILENKIEISTTKKNDHAFQQLKAAYLTYLNGDYDQARKIYSVVLEQKPQNRDALLGVAAIATKQGRLPEARRVYHYLLELNPKDDFAQMSLMGIQGMQEPVARISQLKDMLRRQPDSAQLHFTVGNAYSKLSRWSDAQRSFFQAFELDKHNPNYAYNLAVSLDRLGKVKAAMNYYQRALQLADIHPVSFATTTAELRLQQLGHQQQ